MPVAGTVRADLTAYGARQSYAIKEQTQNAYVCAMCANFVFGAASLDAGVRYERTEQSASGYAVENANLATQRVPSLATGRAT